MSRSVIISRDESFAQLLAAGKPVRVAYQEAGFENPTNASRKKNWAPIKKRLAEIIAQRELLQNQVTIGLAETIIVTRQREIEALCRLADKAEAEGRYGDAIKCHELLGKDIGMFVERSIALNVNADLDSFSDAQLIDVLEGEGVPLDLAAAANPQRPN
jgi:hypothetical protein